MSTVRIIALLIFLACFAAGQHYSKTWPLEKRLAPVFVENRVIQDDALCDPFYAADRRIFTLCWQIALGGQLGTGSCHCAVRLEFAHAGIVVAGQAFCNAITACDPQLVL